MKGQNIKKININDVDYEINKYVKQEINPVLGKLFSFEKFSSVLERAINIKKLNNKKESEEIQINNAIATYYHVNLITKSYLMYILSMIEAKMRTFFEINIINKIMKDFPSKNINEIDDNYWVENLFESKGKYNDFKYKYLVHKTEKSPKLFFWDMTMGDYTFILTRLKKEFVKNFYSRTKEQLKENFVYKSMKEENGVDRELATLKKSLKVVKELRNYIIHKILVLDPLVFDSISDKERPTKPLIESEDKINYIFDSINLVTADMGYTQIGNRISRHIDREIKSKNSKLDKNNIRLDVKTLNLYGFYKKNGTN